MKLEVTYNTGEPRSIVSRSPTQGSSYKFTIEGTTARLADVRTLGSRDRGESAFCVTELNQVHDAVLDLPFIERCTIWSNGRSDTTKEDRTDQCNGPDNGV